MLHLIRKGEHIMLNQEIVKLINEQINKEFYSAYFYLDIANYYISENLNGFANWFNIQAQEEKDHAFLFMKYLQNNNENVILTAIAPNPDQFTSFDMPLLKTFKHEQSVTKSIENIYNIAFENKDFRTLQFLDWFIKEQGEEEKNTDELIKKYELFGKDGKGLYLLDTELASRVYVAPSLVI